VPIPRAVCLRVDFEGYTIGSSDPGLSHQSLIAKIVIDHHGGTISDQSAQYIDKLKACSPIRLPGLHQS
jgi:nanoRNase/pAp phosphatase (c-di-AMP/oligoRNAs hydrolase)